MKLGPQTNACGAGAVKHSIPFAYFILILTSSIFAQTDDLPRHGILGVIVGAADKSRPEDARENPIAVQTVIPSSGAELAGIQAGDIVRTVDDQPVSSSAQFNMMIGRHLAGDRIAIRVVRAGQESTKTATLKPRPFETSPDADVLYRSVTVDGARRRVIITRPKAPGRYPAVMIMGGLGCYSLDGELLSDSGYGPILAMLAKHNFASMRVEKSGEGDSEGPPCTDLKATADLEARGYVAGLRAAQEV
jgi:hypothetical protein